MMDSKKVHFCNLTGSALVFCIVSLVAICTYGLSNSENWIIPPSYGDGDGVWMLNLLDAVAKGELRPFKPFIKSEFAAPFHADYSDWPMGGAIEMLPAWWLINLFGLAVGANLYLILCHAVAGLSMFICLRFMQVKVLWALVFGIAFGLCPYLFHRNFAHITLVNNSYLIPIICAFSWYLFTHNPAKINNLELILVYLLSFFLGAQPPYYTAPYFWALIVAGVFWAINSNWLTSLLRYGICIGCFIGGFLIGYAPALLYSLREGKNFEAVTRYYGELQMLALRPIEMFLPGSNSGIPGLKQLSAFYENQCIFRKNFEFSESMAPYLGLVACLGFLLLFGITFYYVLSKQQFKISGWFWFALILIAFAIVGGLNGFLGLGKFYLLRSSNRYSIYITAISLIYFAILLSRNPLFFNRWISCSAAAALMILITVEPLLANKKFSSLYSSGHLMYNSDKQFGIKMENSLPSGAKIFNFPVVELPERGTYAFFRPTFFTDKIRYSFGALAGRARDTWQLEVEKLQFDEMVEKLKEFGFSGIVIYKGAGLSEETMREVNRASEFFKENQFPSIISEFGDFEFFAFVPNPNPIFPPVQPMYVNNWWSSRIQPAGIEEKFCASETEWRWATHSSAIIEVFNEQKSSRRLSLQGRVFGFSDSDLLIHTRGQTVFSGKIMMNSPLDFKTIPIEVAGHKAIRFEFKTDRKPKSIDGRKFSFGVADLKAKWE